MKIKILTYNFLIKGRKGFVDNKYGDNPNCDLGCINYGTQVIKTDPKHPESDSTVLHELVHAVDKFWCVGLTENQVSKIAEGLYCILKENKIDFSKERIFDES